MTDTQTPEVVIDGVMKEAMILDMSGGKVAFGKVYEDAKGRFPDGSDIRTSYIVEGARRSWVTKTRNSVYRLEMKDV